MRKVLVAALLAVTLVGTRAHAVTYGEPMPWERPHFINGSVGFTGFGTIMAGQNGGQEYVKSGGGVGLWLGLDIGRFVGLRVGYDVGFHNPVGCGQAACSFAQIFGGVDYLFLETVQLDFKLRFPTGVRFAPYLIAGVEVAWIGRAGNLTDAIGGGFEAGAGFDVWVSRYFSVGVEAKYRGLKMSDFAANQGTSTYLNLVQVGGNLAIRF